MLNFLDPSAYYSGDLIVFSLIIDLKQDMFRLVLIIKSKYFDDVTVDGIEDVVDIRSLFYGVVEFSSFRRL